MKFNLNRLLYPLLIASVGLMSAGCSKSDRNQTKLQYMPDMADNPTVKAHESYLNPPDHSVSTTAVLYPEDDFQAEKEFKNPLQPGSKEDLVQGKVLYETYCSVCHGVTGDGKGTLGEAYLGGVVPPVTTDILADRKDGFFFQKISKGGAIMPSYGHATHYLERWKIIAYIRKLQQDAK